eukprot:613360-Lingulodinium_polyedra.AAC.1
MLEGVGKRIHAAARARAARGEQVHGISGAGRCIEFNRSAVSPATASVVGAPRFATPRCL